MPARSGTGARAGLDAEQARCRVESDQDCAEAECGNQREIGQLRGRDAEADSRHRRQRDCSQRFHRRPVRRQRLGQTHEHCADADRDRTHHRVQCANARCDRQDEHANGHGSPDEHRSDPAGTPRQIQSKIHLIPHPLSRRDSRRKARKNPIGTNQLCQKCQRRTCASVCRTDVRPRSRCSPSAE